MGNLSDIQFLKNQEIDRQKWDNCITNSTGELIYARSFYLDNMAKGWNALTATDYSWVMPLTYRKKYAVSYLYQPSFTQQLGVFTKAGVTVPYPQIIEYLKRHYQFWEIDVNYLTPHNFANFTVKINVACNFIIDLKATYENTAEKYHKDLNKNLKRSNRFRHVYKTGDDYNKCIVLYREHYGNRMPGVKENDYKNFSAVCAYALQNKMMVCREVVDEGNVLLASALLLTDGKRMYNLMNTTTEAGRRREANHLLLDAIIREFSGREILLDFEGSDLPGVKHFYENFGAVNQPYFKCKYNALPWPLKIIKS